MTSQPTSAFHSGSAATWKVVALALVLSAPLHAGYDHMVVFGDSLSDNGNVSALVPGLFPSLNYDANRATDGPDTTPATSVAGLAVEQLNGLLNLPPLAPVVYGGNNYAFAFAKTDASGLDLGTLTTPGTMTQVGLYLASHPQASASSLYVLWAGSNDLFDATTVAGIQNAETAAIANLQLQLFGLLNAGAKNILWFNLPDLSLTPAGQSLTPDLTLQLHLSSEKFRNDWFFTIAVLDSLFPSAKIDGVDVYDSFFGLLSNPAAFGFSNVTNPAQGNPNVNPDQYVFWDDEHPTTKADSFLAALAYQSLRLTPVPETSSSPYIVALAVVLVVGRLFRVYRSGRKREEA